MGHGQGGNELPNAFTTLRNYLRNDISNILQLDSASPNYAVGLLICVASEALGKLLGRKGDETVFVRDLLGKHKLPRRIGIDIFNAVRNGLAHFYDTKILVIEGRQVDVVLSWRDRPHLQVIERDWLGNGRIQPGLCLNVRTLWQDLDSFLASTEARLTRSQRLRREMQKRAERLRPLQLSKSTRIWKRFLRMAR